MEGGTLQKISMATRDFSETITRPNSFETEPDIVKNFTFRSFDERQKARFLTSNVSINTYQMKLAVHVPGDHTFFER